MRGILFVTLLLFYMPASAKSSCDGSIVEDVSRTYDSLSSYADIGTLTVKTNASFRFETTFTRNDSFEFVFEYPEKFEHLQTKRIVMTDGAFISETIKQNTQQTVNFSTSTALLFNASGTTFGASMVIPPLLLGLNNIWASKLEAESIETETDSEGLELCKVVYSRANGAVEGYWINERYQIVRYQRRAKSGDREISFEITKFERTH